jgi:hypothetical protein
VLGAVMPGECRHDVRLRGLAPGVPMLREGRRSGLSRDNVAGNAQPGNAGEIADGHPVRSDTAF